MGIVQVIIDRTTSMVIEGSYEFDRDDGGILVAPSGSAFPGTPAAGEWFWRTDESKLYRRNDGNTAWDAATAVAAAHATTHEPGGGDPLTVDATAATGSLRTIGTGALQACAGNDSRLSDARTPTAHASSHEVGGGDLLSHQSITGSGTNTHAQIDSHVGSTANPHSTTASQVGAPPTSRQIATTNGLQGGGDLSANRTLSPVYGSAANTVCEGDDSRLSDARTPKDFQHVESLARSTTTSTTYQTKVTLTTPALTGTYRIGWHAVVDQSAIADKVYARLWNSTDSAVFGTEQRHEPKDVTSRIAIGGFGVQVFTGSSKSFVIQWRQQDGNTAGIQDAHIEIWRVS